MAARCFWDADTDSYAQDIFMNVSSPGYHWNMLHRRSQICARSWTCWVCCSSQGESILRGSCLWELLLLSERRSQARADCLVTVDLRGTCLSGWEASLRSTTGWKPAPYVTWGTVMKEQEKAEEAGTSNRSREHRHALRLGHLFVCCNFSKKETKESF